METETSEKGKSFTFQNRNGAFSCCLKQRAPCVRSALGPTRHAAGPAGNVSQTRSGLTGDLSGSLSRSRGNGAVGNIIRIPLRVDSASDGRASKTLGLPRALCSGFCVLQTTEVLCPGSRVVFCGDGVGRRGFEFRFRRLGSPFQVSHSPGAWLEADYLPPLTLFTSQ